MIKLLDLERHLLRRGCRLLREGGRHSVWVNDTTGQRSSVPRHREMPQMTAKTICKQLGVEPIT